MVALSTTVPALLKPVRWAIYATGHLVNSMTRIGALVVNVRASNMGASSSALNDDISRIRFKHCALNPICVC